MAGVATGCTFLASANAAGPTMPIVGVKTTGADEWAPASQGDWFSWTQASHRHPGRPNVFVQQGTGPRLRVNAPGTHAGGSDVQGNTLFYYEWKGDNPGNIRMFNLQSHRRSNLPAKVHTRWDEYYPSMSGPWLLFTRSLSRWRTAVLLYNTQTHVLRTLATDSGRHRWVYSGQVRGDYVSWGRVLPDRADVYLYRISTQTSALVPRAAPEQYNPAVAADGTIYYAESGNNCGEAVSLVRYVPGGVATDLHDFPAGTDLGYTYVDERTDGSLQLFYSQFTCRGVHSDIYRGTDSYTVTVSKLGTGAGTVTSSPTGIDCGATCQSIFHGGHTVTLTATPDPGSILSGWSDASCGTNPTCPVSVESNVSLTATFDPAP